MMCKEIRTLFDLLTQDVGFIPRVNGREVAGYDLYSGGGMGMTHNQADTMPLLQRERLRRLW